LESVNFGKQEEVLILPNPTGHKANFILSPINFHLDMGRKVDDDWSKK